MTPLAPEAVPEFAERFARYARTRGFIPNSIRTMARRPAIAAAFMALNQAPIT